MIQSFEYNLQNSDSNKKHTLLIVGGKTPVKQVNGKGAALYSNYNIENKALRMYLQGGNYENGDALLTKTNTSTKDNPHRYDSFVYRSSVTHKSASSKYLQTTYTRHPSYYFTYNQDSSSNGEWPEPVVFNTKGGTVIKFYDTEACNNEVYSKATQGAITLIYNLIPETTYYYKVFNGTTLIQGIYNETKTYGKFTTIGRIRMIKLEGVRNVRDCGGHLTSDGSKRLRYGLIFRGAMLQPGFHNNYTSGQYNGTKKQRGGKVSSSDVIHTGGATENDVNELINYLKLGGDIDLRDITGNSTVDVNNKDYLNQSLNFFKSTDGVTHYPIATSTNKIVQSYYTLINSSSTIGKTQFTNFIKYIYRTIKSGKSVYIHCQQGRDRTGTFLAVLYALLGISDNGILQDYEMSTLWGNTSTRYYLYYSTSDGSGSDKGLTWSTGTALSAAPFTDVRTGVANWLGSVTDDGVDVIAALKNLLLESVDGQRSYSYVVDDEEVKVLVGRHQVSSVNDAVLKCFYYVGEDYVNTNCYQFKVNAGDKIVVKSVSKKEEPVRLATFYAETNLDIITALQKSTSTYPTSGYLYNKCISSGYYRNPKQSNDYITITEKYISGDRANKHVINIGNTCNFFIAIRNDGEYINTGASDSRSLAIYKNGTLIYGSDITVI